MFLINHTSTPTVRARLLREIVPNTKKILYITDMSEDIFILQKYAYELSGMSWKEITSLSLLWDALESETGYFFLSTDLLRTPGNLTHLKRESGIWIERGDALSETTVIESLIKHGYTHGDAHDTPATYHKQGGTLTIRDALLPMTLQIEWFDTELDSIIMHRDGKREHVANIRISNNSHARDAPLSEVINPVLLEVIGEAKNTPSSMQIITSGCDFLDEKDDLLTLSDLHMGAFTQSDGGSVDAGIPEIASIIELRELLLSSEISLEFFTRYPKTLISFCEENSIPEDRYTLKEIRSFRLVSAEWNYDAPVRQYLKTSDTSRHMIIADDVLGEIFVKKRSKKSIAKHLDLLLTLKPGDYIVHREHGIGLFHAVVKKRVGEIEREYLELHYSEGDKLFVPLTEIYRVSKYIGENTPTLTRLSGTEWERTLAKTDEEIARIAEDILETSARRSLATGRSFGAFPEESARFQAAFAYEYTPDQRSAIEDIFHDMESSAPMDRLISGDVGFGKTEVAMNAIYKAVLSGMQVVVLSPLLVLADEHYETFTERLGAFGVRVGVLTRMSTPSEIRETLLGIKNGTLDVIVGTHRLISDDVIWKKLGLLIIDEEHKFGVTHKEKIKKLRAGLDILSLSATPIPRSLNLALSGLKKISLLATPPKKKKPIETIVSRWNEGIIKTAINTELSRSGQVIIVHNRIQGMDRIASEISTIVGGKSAPCMVITHGQMPAETIEDRIHAFKKGEYEILLTTTIIENGVNFLSANTIIIIDPEDFGLASLHQLRGRVGRRDEQGYSYLLYRKPELSTDEKNRLVTIANNTHLGAGFEIAMRDMEIRGAGDVLGVKQAGKSKEVGLTLYFRLLEEKIEELKNIQKKRIWTKIELELSISINEDTFRSEADKLNFYREIENIETLEELEIIEGDMTDDAPSTETTNLFLLLRARLLLSEYGVIRVSRLGMNYVFDFREDMDVTEIKRFLERFDRKKQFTLVSVKKIRVETRYWSSVSDFLRELA